MSRIETSMCYVKSIKPHFHKDELEIILVLQGEITYYKVERKVKVKAGEFVFANRFVPHYIESDGATILTSKIKIEEFAHIFPRIAYVEFMNFDELMVLDKPLKQRINQILEDFIIKDYLLNNSQDTNQKYFNEDLIAQLLFSHYQLISHLKKEDNYLKDDILDRYYLIVEYVWTHIHEKIVVDDVLKCVYMNGAYFSQFMKNISGNGFKEFATYRKLIVCVDMLIDTDMSMIDIADSVGIRDMKSFYIIFKRYFQISPAKYRAMMRKIQNDYELIDDLDIINNYIDQYCIHLNDNDNTIEKAYHYLYSFKKDLNTLEYEIIISPYQDMGDEIDETYQPYKYIYMLATIIENSTAKCVLRYPFWILKDQNHWNLLLTSLSSLAHAFGFNP
ncbi:MAG: AraC family transcriptional regulator [Erysipelotrichaceae bacterium]|nr:AraC family transcriptional regulator [Erysipelotrichaceae bacterium]